MHELLINIDYQSCGLTIILNSLVHNGSISYDIRDRLLNLYDKIKVNNKKREFWNCFYRDYNKKLIKQNNLYKFASLKNMISVVNSQINKVYEMDLQINTNNNVNLFRILNYLILFAG